VLIFQLQSHIRNYSSFLNLGKIFKKSDVSYSKIIILKFHSNNGSLLVL
jgi:hypothetical protein